MKKQVILEGFNAFEVIRQLQFGNLTLSTLPDEQWILSCARHKTLLVDVYTLIGKIGNKPVTYRCGRLCELLLRLLYTGRTVKYHSYLPQDEGLTAHVYARKQLADTLEEDAMLRLRSGDIRFFLPDSVWRLSNTSFGQSRQIGFDFFHFADEQTLGTSALRYYASTSLERVLLEFLCQNSTFNEHSIKVLEFKPRQGKGK